MTGLILKDLLSLKKSGIKIAVVLVFASAGNISFLCTMITLLLTMFIMNTFAYDELSKWDSYALSLPVTKNQIVLSKYLLSLFFGLIGICISLVIFLTEGQIIRESLITLYALASAAMIMTAIMLPLCYKFGTQKARIWFLFIVLTPSICITPLKYMINITPPQISDAAIEMSVYLSLPIALLLFIGSYFLSCKIFNKKEI